MNSIKHAKTNLKSGILLFDDRRVCVVRPEAERVVRAGLVLQQFPQSHRLLRLAQTILRRMRYPAVRVSHCRCIATPLKVSVNGRVDQLRWGARSCWCWRDRGQRGRRLTCGWRSWTWTGRGPSFLDGGHPRRRLDREGHWRVSGHSFDWRQVGIWSSWREELDWLNLDFQAIKFTLMMHFGHITLT